MTDEAKRETVNKVIVIRSEEANINFVFDNDYDKEEDVLIRSELIAMYRGPEIKAVNYFFAALSGILLEMASSASRLMATQLATKTGVVSLEHKDISVHCEQDDMTIVYHSVIATSNGESYTISESPVCWYYGELNDKELKTMLNGDNPLVATFDI